VSLVRQEVERFVVSVVGRLRPRENLRAASSPFPPCTIPQVTCVHSSWGGMAPNCGCFRGPSAGLAGLKLYPIANDLVAYVFGDEAVLLAKGARWSKADQGNWIPWSRSKIPCSDSQGILSKSPMVTWDSGVDERWNHPKTEKFPVFSLLIR